MAGGGNRAWDSRTAARIVAAVLFAVLATSNDVTIDRTFAQEQEVDASSNDVASRAREATTKRPEQVSIVVDTDQQQGTDVVESNDDAPLEPIANTSENVPDRATPRGSTETHIPTPADPKGSPAYAGDDDVEPVDPAPVGVETESEDEEVNRPANRVASFHGVTPGVTTRADLLRKWGQPDSPGGASLLHFKFDAFPTVSVQLSGGVVDAVQVSLAKPVGAIELAARLNLDDVTSVVERDANGVAIATAYPGRGVVFGHQMDLGVAFAMDGSGTLDQPEGPETFEILIRRINPDVFVLRAEQAALRAYSEKIDDLESALEIDPTNVEARYRLSELAIKVGQIELAEQLAAEAVELRPRDDSVRLQWAKCLMQLARYDEAVAETRKILEGETASPLVQAQALHQMGLLASLGSKQVAEQALPLQHKAIDLADTLAVDDDDFVAISASQLLVDAHLAVADCIADGDWQQKQQSVAEWISRASALAEQMIADKRGDELLRLQVALSALRTSVKLDPPVDPELWITEAEEAVRQLSGNQDDRFAKTEREWQLGLAYLYASEIQHRRGEADRAFHFGDRAQAHLEQLADIWSGNPDVNFILGRVFFQNGAVQAVHYDDHEAACQFYDRAVELLMKPAPVTAHATPSRHGDALVSMGVSYWRVGQRDRAHKLTKAGFELVQQGVAEGLLGPKSLDVPRNNLASMSQALGLSAEGSPVQQATSSTGPTRIAGREPQSRSGRPSTTRTSGGRQPATRSSGGALRR